MHYGQGYINAGNITVINLRSKVEVAVNACNFPNSLMLSLSTFKQINYYAILQTVDRRENKIASSEALEELRNATGCFRQYDYGMKKNLHMYNSTVPPDYRLEKITAPIALFSSDNDWLATTKVRRTIVVQILLFLKNRNWLLTKKNSRKIHDIVPLNAR